MATHRKLRQNILVGDGTTYTLRMCIIRELAADGTPRHLELLDMDEKVDLTSQANRNFMTMYVPQCMMRPKGE